ncbi:hypothetical protein ACFFS2_36180 [Streptomyces aurantiacus]|uniref:Uncharacterized protein n=1 Tax=Streptomyces aurantiacus TaxID=47760 RepID=A0A7G1P5G8_9ACTN|nr:hypothetical protein [Streptomyces aurantiacus]BCL30242.1 hypothetical protein GCM10017557_51010 [Streptomyces aurantiacus]
MAVYVSIRGWIECDPKQLDSLKNIIAEHSDNAYSGGWGFPAQPFNWTSYAFYGGDLQVADVPWLRNQLAEMAALQPGDEDESQVEGLFLVTHEVDGLTEWQIRDGGLYEVPGSEGHAYLGA